MKEKETKVVNLKDYTKEQLNQMVNDNAAQLSVAKGKKVEGLLLNTGGLDSEEGDWVIGYYLAPSLYQKMTLLDNIEKDKLIRGHAVLKQNLIKEHSDPRLVDYENSNNDRITIGASLSVITKAIDFSVNQIEDLKKNGE